MNHLRGRRALLVCCTSLAAGAALRPARALAATPRVISVGGALTEIVYRLGAQEWLIATDTTSTFPEAARSLPKVGYQRSLSAEGVLAMRPTVLLATADAGPPAALQQLQTAGVRVVRTDAAHSFDSLLANLAVIATALDRNADGSRVAQTLREEWAATRQSIRPINPPPKVLFVLSHAANSVQVSGADTAADAMIRLAGGVNALSGFQGYRPMTAESVIAAAPDVILTTREGVEALGGVDALLSRPGLALTPAGRAKRVIAPEALYLLGFGPRLPKAVQDLARGFGTA